jgi:hypothetical protein
MQQILYPAVVIVNPLEYVCGMNDATTEIKEVSLKDKDCPKIFKVGRKAASQMIKAMEDDGFKDGRYEAKHFFKDGRVYKFTIERIDQD